MLPRKHSHSTGKTDERPLPERRFSASFVMVVVGVMVLAFSEPCLSESAARDFPEVVTSVLEGQSISGLEAKAIAVAVTRFEKHMVKQRQFIREHPSFNYSAEDFERCCAIASFRFYFDIVRKADRLIISVNDREIDDISIRNVSAVYEFSLITKEFLAEDYPM